MWARAKYYYRMGQQGQSDKFDKEDEKMEVKIPKTFVLPLQKTKPTES